MTNALNNRLEKLEKQHAQTIAEAEAIPENETPEQAYFRAIRQTGITRTAPSAKALKLSPKEAYMQVIRGVEEVGHS